MFKVGDVVQYGMGFNEWEVTEPGQTTCKLRKIPRDGYRTQPEVEIRTSELRKIREVGKVGKIKYEKMAPNDGIIRLNPFLEFNEDGSVTFKIIDSKGNRWSIMNFTANGRYYPNQCVSKDLGLSLDSKGRMLPEE